jgi:predicted RNase H-like nuclease (RuvC/YqgF family)
MVEKMMDWERKYYRLLEDYRDLERTVEKLQNSNAKLEDKLYDSEWRIKKELEPRIKREERNYDIFVTSPEREEA